jgi:ribosomal protein S18 acetylase RimI-like enzyme
MGVLDGYQRDSVERILLDYTRGLGTNWMMLEVNINNTAAQTLYESQGFEKFSVRKGL